MQWGYLSCWLSPASLVCRLVRMASLTGIWIYAWEHGVQSCWPERGIFPISAWEPGALSSLPEIGTFPHISAQEPRGAQFPHMKWELILLFQPRNLGAAFLA